MAYKQHNQTRHIPLPSKPPVLVKDWEAINKHIAEALSNEVLRVQRATKDLQIQRHDSIYTGISGIAMMEYHLAGISIPLQHDALTPKSLIHVADQHLARVIRYRPPYVYSFNRLSFIESGVGIAALVLSRGLWTSEPTIVGNWKAAKDFLESNVEQVLLEDAELYSPGEKEDGCEVLYGRAGLLYALLYLRNSISGKPHHEIASLENLTSDSNLARLVDSIMSRGKHGAFSLASEFRMDDQPQLPPLMWTWHRKRYLGGAHAGILQILLACPGSIIQKHLSEILGTIRWLITCQDEAGNWPSKCPTQRGVSSENELVQWCHGAPGVIILLSTTLRVLHDHEGFAADGVRDDIVRSIQQGARFVYKHGLLRKGVGLCHGVAGSVYALLAASDALDSSSNKRFFAKAAHLAFLATLREDLTTSKEMLIPDHPWSLYEGIAGACCAYAEVLSRLDSNDSRRSVSGFPGYNDFCGI
ncbi:LanC-like protein GCL2 [Psilocybe cubensis]|uniref:LanC-like protein GCL2 n=2 Tax=Psilocybe cubensis TaxID=181762 RepID=A0ACB8GK61_PSICU|nr:LanC-like protein GCL2 [Psilocybe cubensis]KAH9475889.1 LanC-like protein GCL2 [Psilocybe cubensis]